MKINLDILDTEKRNKNSLNIDKLSTKEIIEIINNEDKTVANAVEKELGNISKAIDGIYEKLSKGGRLIYIGAGTSGRLGVLDASECPPTYGVDFELVQGIMAGGQSAMFKAKEGAEDSRELAVEDLKNIDFNEKDSLVGLAASGRTPYVLGALEYANKIGAFTSSVCCVKDGEISKLAKVGIEVVCGPEVVTGSTRMKAGTAQKLVLNMISTTVMIKSGKVFGNLMIDVKATNEKLVERAKRIIIMSTDCSRDIATEYFEKSGRNVKVAIFMILSGMTKEESIRLIEGNSGNISKALYRIKK